MMKDIQEMISVTWDITGKCNLRCKHCYNAETYFSKNGEEYKIDLDLETSIKTVKQLYLNGFNHIHFLGGEPLMADHLYEVIKVAKNYDMCVTINSNATLLDEKMQKNLIDLRVDHYAASLDGADEETNDEIRGKGTFRAVCNNMKILKQEIKRQNSDMQTAIAFTLTHANYKTIDKLPIIAKELDVDLIIITMFLNMGNGKKNLELFELENEQMIKALETLAEVNANGPQIPIQLDSRPLLIDYLNSRYGHVYFNKKNSLCSAGDKSIYIEANGGIHPCLSFRFENCVINNQEEEKINIKTTTIKNALNSVTWRKFLSNKSQFNVKNIAGCSECSFTEVCQPCFLYYSNYQEVEECMCLKKLMHKYYNELKNVYVIKKEGILFQDGQVINNDNIIAKVDDPVSMDIIDCILRTDKISEIASFLSNKYDIAFSTLEYDLLSFLFKFKRMNIIDFLNIENATFRLNPDILSDSVENEETVVFDPKNGIIYELDEVSSYIWKKLDNNSFGNIVKSVCDIYDIGVDCAQKDISNIILEAIKNGLIYFF